MKCKECDHESIYHNSYHCIVRRCECYADLYEAHSRGWQEEDEEDKE
jgi:hypothetical protein